MSDDRKELEKFTAFVRKNGDIIEPLFIFCILLNFDFVQKKLVPPGDEEQRQDAERFLDKVFVEHASDPIDVGRRMQQTMIFYQNKAKSSKNEAK